MSAFITCVDNCSLVFNAYIFLMNESILFPFSNPTNETECTEQDYYHHVCVAPHS